jgi:ABC-type transporter Mla subunit MlaD
MSTPRPKTEVFVGLFLLMGFAVIACMVIVFGKTGEGSKSTYKLTVEFPNASGLVKGASVLVSGASIGHVVAGPNLVPDTYKITAVLAIRADVKLPRQSRFIIGSSGLLGDKFVDVQMPEGYTLDDPLQPGEYIAPAKHSGGGGLAELTDKGSLVMDRLVSELEHIEKLTQSLQEGLLHERNLKNIEVTFDNLKTTSEHFREASQNLDGVVSKAGSLLDTTQSTVKTYEATAGDLKETIVEVQKMISSATKAVDNTSLLMKKASEGDGPLGTLIADKKMAEDLKALAANLRRSGVLFYKDRPLTGTPAPAVAAPKPRR